MRPTRFRPAERSGKMPSRPRARLERPLLQPFRTCGFPPCRRRRTCGASGMEEIHMYGKVAGAVFLTLLLVGSAFSQNAQLGGIVSDASGAVMPGVSIIATNTDTGVTT